MQALDKILSLFRLTFPNKDLYLAIGSAKEYPDHIFSGKPIIYDTDHNITVVLDEKVPDMSYGEDFDFSTNDFLSKLSSQYWALRPVFLSSLTDKRLYYNFKGTYITKHNYLFLEVLSYLLNQSIHFNYLLDNSIAWFQLGGVHIFIKPHIDVIYDRNLILDVCMYLEDYE